MRVKGYFAFVFAFAVLLLMFSTLGLVGSIDTMIENKNLEILWIIGLALVVVSLLSRRVEI